MSSDSEKDSSAKEVALDSFDEKVEKLYAETSKLGNSTTEYENVHLLSVDKKVEDKKVDDTSSPNENDHGDVHRSPQPQQPVMIHAPAVENSHQDELEDIDSVGHELWTFLENVPDLMVCKICCNVFESPRLLACCSSGICKKCIECHLQASARLADQRPACPFCRNEDIRLVKYISLEESINSLKVQCWYKSKGCGWTGTLQNGKLHLRVCDFFPVSCPNKCDKRFERHKLSAHLPECPFQHVGCSFEVIGCKTHSVLLREGARGHAHDNIHHHLLLIAKFNAQVLDEHKSLSESVQSQTKTSHRESVVSQHEALKSSKESIESFKISLQEVRKKTALLKHELTKEEICLTQLKAKVKQLKEIEGDYMGTFAQIEAQPIPTATGIFCPPITYTISNFKRRMTVNDRWLSPPFYTHEGGYKLCLSVYPKSDNASFLPKYVSVNVHLMTGEFDDHLEWPFAGALITVTAVSQRARLCNKSAHLPLCGEDTAYIRTRHLDGTFGYGIGHSTFLSHDSLPNFLTMENCLELKIYRIQFPL